MPVKDPRPSSDKTLMHNLGTHRCRDRGEIAGRASRVAIADALCLLEWDARHANAQPQGL